MLTLVLKTLFSVLKQICSDVLSYWVKKNSSFCPLWYRLPTFVEINSVSGTKEDSLSQKHLYVIEQQNSYGMSHSVSVLLWTVHISERSGGQSNIFWFIFFSVRERAVFYQSYDLIGSENGQYSRPSGPLTAGGSLRFRMAENTGSTTTSTSNTTRRHGYMNFPDVLRTICGTRLPIPQ